MSLEKVKVLDQIEIKANGVIFVKELNQIIEDGQIISSIPHRTSYVPGSDISEAIDQVKEAAAIFWTEAVITDYRVSAGFING